MSIDLYTQVLHVSGEADKLLLAFDQERPPHLSVTDRQALIELRDQLKALDTKLDHYLAGCNH